MGYGWSDGYFFFKGFIDNSLPQALYFRPFLNNIFIFFFIVFLFLKSLGGLPIEEPFASNTQNTAILYFSYILIVIFLLSAIESRFYKEFKAEYLPVNYNIKK